MTTYVFSCCNCGYRVQLKLGLTMIEHYKRLPNRQLAVCKNCKTLTSTNNKLCQTCEVRAETGRWLSRKTGFKILDSSMIRKDSKIPCPKCDFKYIDAIPIVFID